MLVSNRSQLVQPASTVSPSARMLNVWHQLGGGGGGGGGGGVGLLGGTVFCVIHEM
jgi:hypothetical protein